MQSAGAQARVMDQDQTGARLRRAALRQLLPIAIVALFVMALRDQVMRIDTDAVLAAFGHVTAPQWIAALAATGVSFWALGHYDAVLHRHLGTGVPCPRARRAGSAAIAISQTLGFGLATGAVVRWRLLPGMRLWQAAQVTAVVALSFIMGWAVVTSLVVLVLPLPALGLFRLLAAGVLGLALLGVALSLAAPPLRIAGRTLAWPSLVTMGRIVALAAIDTGAAALALWVLMPDGSAPGFALLLPAYLLAFGAGLLSSTPGGVGAFELTLLALLPDTPAEPLLAAVLAYRAVYFALPAVLGGVAMAFDARARDGTEPRPALMPPASEVSPTVARLIARAPRAEAMLLRQGEHGMLIDGTAHAGWMTGLTRQAMVALSDPMGPPDATPDLIRRLMQEAARSGRLPCLYKCGARAAVQARRMGWQTHPVAVEAWLTPATFDPATPARAGLRRKLRRAEKAGLRIERGSLAGATALPLAQMADIAARWAQARGGERGFSMGRFAPDYVSGQQVWLAYTGDRLCAFATFNANDREWTLDLMRQQADAPDGDDARPYHCRPERSPRRGRGPPVTCRPAAGP